jgi:hypothetical protein
MPKRSVATTEQQSRDITCRTITTRADTVDDATRSVEAVLSTEEVVQVWDWSRFQVIDEVLLARGAELPDQVVLLENHRRWELDDVLGSVRNLRVETDTTVGRLFFDEDEGRAEKAWGKYRRGHVRDVSVGYKVVEYVDIAPGQRKTVDGKEYRARDRVLRVTQRWKLREVSATPIGADEGAKTRTDFLPIKEGSSMNERLRKFLESVGLRSDATDELAQQFADALSGRSAEIVKLLKSEDETDTSTVAVRGALRALGVDPDDPSKTLPEENAGQGTASRAEAGDGAGGEAIESVNTPTVDADVIRTEERARFAMVQRVGGQDLSEETRDQAVREGWDEARVSSATLEAVRGNRSESVGPAIHSRSREADCTREALGAAMMIREGLDPVARAVRFDEGVYVPRREGERTDHLEQAADRGWAYRDWSLIDFCREACRLDGITVPMNRREVIRAAVSGSALTNIFSTSVNAQLLSGYTDYADTTDGWTSAADVPNFQTNERMMMGKFGALQKLARGKTAEHLDESDSKEEYKIARYAGQFVVDEQDMIDDRLGAINQVSPSDIGSSAAQLRPNLVYAILLANAALSDTGLLFNSTAETTAGGHANLLQDAYDAAGMQAGLLAMAKHRIRTRPLNIRARYILAPQDLKFAILVSLKSASRDYDGTEGIYNPLYDLGIEARFDDRLGAVGVVDPATETAYTGSATNWFLTARPGENGAKTIEVGYLRGTGRAPQSRSFVLTQGQWGIGWDINLDIGAKALDYRAMQYSDGTS